MEGTLFHLVVIVLVVEIVVPGARHRSLTAAVREKET